MHARDPIATWLLRIGDIGTQPSLKSECQSQLGGHEAGFDVRIKTIVDRNGMVLRETRKLVAVANVRGIPQKLE